MRKTRLVMLIMALALALALALAVASCGSKKKSSSSNGGGTLTGTQIAAKSDAAMQSLKGATIGLGISAKVGLTAKASATNKALLKDPISVNGTIKFNGTSVSSMDLDATATAKLGTTTYNAGAKITGGEGWLGLMGQWYTLPASYFSQASSSPTPSASSSPGGLSSELQKLGINPSSLVTTSKLVGTESIDGQDAYHISDTLDTNALATALSSLLAQSSSSTSAGTSASAASAIATLKSALKNATINIWYEKDNFYLRKIVVTANMDLSSDPQVAATGISTVDLSITVTLGSFNASVTVTPPTSPLPFDQLTNSLGSLTGGASTGL